MRGRCLAIPAILALLPACGDGGDDDDPAPSAAPAGGGSIQFAAATYAVDEAGGTVSLTVQRSGSGEAAVWFQTEDGTAGAGDFEAAPSTELVWAAGDTAPKTVTISVKQDKAVEGLESFFVHLGSNRGAALGPTSVARVDIADDEAAPAGVFQFSSGRYGAPEGTQVSVTVLRSGGTAGAAAVEVAVDHGSAGASDYAVVGGGFPLTLSWADGEGGARTFNIELAADGDAEGDQAFRLVLEHPTPGSFAGSPKEAVVDILDADRPGAIRFAASAYEASETGGPRTITVRRQGGVQGAVSVTVAVDGGTAVPGDFTFTPATLSWAAGEAGDRTVVVTPVADAADEGDETAVFRLEDPQGGVQLGAPASTVLTIHD